MYYRTRSFGMRALSVTGLQLADEKDRQVLASAIRAPAQTIVTFNLKDFPAAALDPLGIEASITTTRTTQAFSHSLPGEAKEPQIMNPRAQSTIVATSP